MRFARFSIDGSPRVGVVIDSQIHEVDYTLRDLLVLSTAGAGGQIERAFTGAVHDLTEVDLLAPVDESARGLLCIGINYAEHQQESADVFVSELPSKPIVFLKPPSAVANPGAALDLSERVSTSFDWEAELGIVIGAPGRFVTRDQAEGLIAGYTVINDITARDLQQEHVQWFMGKALDRSTPVGPWVVTRDEIGPNPDLEISLAVNGEGKQRSRTSQMVFDPAALIESISRVVTLMPGDVIATGTPSGVGFKRTPPEFLGAGDDVSATIERIGTLSNSVASGPRSTGHAGSTAVGR
jgi:2-keto-4-pentenoate hydratase/2-oxohepta-3-ene-1,7-dioic acid hydratase in catechol pathway